MKDLRFLRFDIFEFQSLGLDVTSISMRRFLECAKIIEVNRVEIFTSFEIWCAPKLVFVCYGALLVLSEFQQIFSLRLIIGLTRK